MASKDIMADIKRLEEEGAEEKRIADLVKQRRQKIDADSNLSQYEESQKALEQQYGLAMAPAEPVEAEVITPSQFDIQRQLLQQQAGQQRTGALSAIEAERAERLPQFQQERNVISGQAAQGAKALDEYLARAGLVGSTTQGQLAQQQRGQEQSLLGQSQMAETQFLGDLARRQTTAEQAYQQALTSGQLQIGLQEAQAAEAARQQAFQNQLAQAQLTGMYDGAPTIAGQQLGMQQQAQAFQQQMATAQFDESVRQNNLAQQNFQQQFTYQQMQDRIANQYRAGQLSLQQANAALAQARFAAEQDPNSLDNQIRQQQLYQAQLQTQQMQDGLTAEPTPEPTPTTPKVIGGMTFGLTDAGEKFVKQIETSEYVSEDDVGRTVDRIGIRDMLEAALDAGEVDPETAKQVYEVYNLGNIGEPGNVLNPMLLNPALGLGVGQ